MTGQELKEKLKEWNLRSVDIAQKMGISPQVLNAKFTTKMLKADFLDKMEEVVQEYGYTLINAPAERKTASDSYWYELVCQLREEIKEKDDRIMKLEVERALLTHKLEEYTSEKEIQELLRKAV